MFGLYFFLSDVTNLFDVHLIFVHGKVAGCFAAREKKKEAEENVEDVKINFLINVHRGRLKILLTCFSILCLLIITR
jgi:hypothetical protein